MNAPPDAVLAAFGLEGRVTQPFRGGRAWSAGDIVLKRVDDVAEAAWIADVLSDLAADGFRINRPVRPAEDGWLVAGWAAWERLAGDHDDSGRWTEILHVGKRLNAALAGLRRPDFLDARTHAWAVGDRVAWGDQPVVVTHEPLRPLADRLSAHVRPYDGPAQVVHGDLTGNVLFAPGRLPGVIDFTPYWRPAPFSLAVVVVDALLWHSAPASLIDALPDGDDRTSMLARGALFRLIASDRLASGMAPDARGDHVRASARDHERLLRLLDGRNS